MLSVLVLLSRFCVKVGDKSFWKLLSMEGKNVDSAKPPRYIPDVFQPSHDVASSASSMSSSASSTSSTDMKMSKTHPEHSQSKVVYKMEAVKEKPYKDLNLNHYEESENVMETVRTFLAKQNQLIDELERQRQEKHESLHDPSKTNEEIRTLELSLTKYQATISDLTSRLKEKEIEIFGLKAELGKVGHSSLQDVRTVGTSTVGTSGQSNNQDSNASLSTANVPSEFMSLPISSPFNENKQLKEQIQKLNLTIEKLKDMNMKWQNYNDQRETFVKQLGEENEHLKQIVRQLTEENEQLSASTSTRNAGVLEFTPAQQVYVDSVYQKLRSEADRQKELVEITKNESQKNLLAERKLREEAQTTAQELSTKVTEQEAKINDLFVQNDELKSALVVATRSHDFTSQAEQESTINSLREAARQYELDYAKLQDEYSRSRQEVSNLQERLRRTTTVTGAATGTNNPVMSQSFLSGRSWYEDIETDVPTSGNYQAYRSMSGGRSTPSSANNISPPM